MLTKLADLLKTIPFWVKLAIVAAVIIFGAFYLKSCRPSDYWKGQYDLAQEKIKGLNNTVNSLDKSVAELRVRSARDQAEWGKKVSEAEEAIALARGAADSLGTVNASLEEKLAAASTDAQRVPILQSQVENLKAQNILKDTQLEEARKIIVADRGLMEKKDAVYAELSTSYNIAASGLRAALEVNEISKNLVKALRLENKSLRFQATVGKVGLATAVVVAGYLLLKK